MLVVAVAPCQCFSPGGHTTTSPARISRFGPPEHCTQPRPEVTTSLCPSGWVCHAVRLPGSNVTKAAETREGSTAGNSGSILTLPVNHSAGPLPEGCDPLCLICIVALPKCRPVSGIQAAAWSAESRSAPSPAHGHLGGIS